MNVTDGVKYTPFTETTTIDGELVRIGGKDKSAHALILDQEGKAWSIEMDRKWDQQIAAYLYKGPILRITGEVRWERQSDGTWQLLSFKLSDFVVLNDDSLEDVTDRLRQLRQTDWDKVDDLDDYICVVRGESDF